VAKKAQGNTEMTDRELIYCTGCDHDKKPSEFYKSYGTTKSGTLPYCKQCCINMSLNNIGSLDVDNFKNMLSKVDRPFLYQTLADNLKKYPNKIESAIGFYFKDLGMVQNRGSKYKDSIFEPSNINENSASSIITSKKAKYEIEDMTYEQLEDKYGVGYTDEEYYCFEKKWRKLADSYGQKTSIHTESLTTYIRFRVKEELATAKGDVAEATKWGGLAEKAQQSGKLNVSQLSKSDISGGVDLLPQLFEAVEDKVGIIPILPKLKEQPYDDADLIIWSIIEYMQRLEDKPRTQYKDIWNFYDEMLVDFYKQKGFSDEKIQEERNKRNAVFRDLTDVYKEPLYEDGDI